MQACDVDGLVKILVQFSKMIMDFPEISEVDINPLAVSYEEFLVLDAKIVLDKALIGKNTEDCMRSGIVYGTAGMLDGIIDRNIEKELDLYELLRKTLHGPTPLEQVVTDYIRATGVRSDKMVEKDFVRHTARVRILALVSVGEFSIEDGMVIPRF